jgi:hypothetical protein
MPKSGTPKETRRFGIGEWFARPFHRLTPRERQQLAEIALSRSHVSCPPRVTCQTFAPQAVPGGKTVCTKAGGVCSLREYTRIDDGKSVGVSLAGNLRVTCPYRFAENGTVFEWIGREVLGTSAPLVVRELEFLEAAQEGSADAKEVGQIDNVLIHPTRFPLHWCALEIQAVYFSGRSMAEELRRLKTDTSRIPFPSEVRRPDYRSSGPKRLMPQLQIKVPSLRRWGRKMAVVIDEEFFGALGKMDDVSDISNCDIAWFVVRFEEAADGSFALRPAFRRFTTLERAVEGLTGGTPVTLSRFETAIAGKVARLYPDQAASLGLVR